MVRILIVDDSAFMRNILKKILSGRYEIVGEASNGKEAVEMYFKLKPDVVLMDIVMPIMDGIEATRQIVSKDPNARVIMVTSLGQNEKVKEAIKAGARGYIVKPFQAEGVIREIENVLKQR